MFSARIKFLRIDLCKKDVFVIVGQLPENFIPFNHSNFILFDFPKTRPSCYLMQSKLI